VGDLGNLVAGDDGKVTVTLTDSVISLRGPHSIVGRTLVSGESRVLARHGRSQHQLQRHVMRAHELMSVLACRVSLPL